MIGASPIKGGVKPFSPDLGVGYNSYHEGGVVCDSLTSYFRSYHDGRD